MKKPASRAGIGASSIMLIIVVVCLTLFGVLSFVMARNDAALTERTIAGTQAYYTADAAAQRQLAAIDEWIASGMTGEPEGVELSDNGDGSYSFSAAGDGAHALRVRLKIGAAGFEILAYTYENTAPWTADTAAGLYE